MEIPNEILLPGDILFVVSQDFMGKLIQIRQSGLKFLDPKEFIPTHVCLVITESGLLIESTYNDGVRVNGIHKYIENKEYNDKILILRNKQLEREININQNLLDDYYKIFVSNWLQNYNKIGAVVKKKIEGKKFCSELAVSCLNNIGISFIKLTPEKTYPLELLVECLQSDDWREVKAAALLSLSPSKINSICDEFAYDIADKIIIRDNLISLKEKIKSGELNNTLLINQINRVEYLSNLAKQGKLESLENILITIETIRKERLQNASELRNLYEEAIKTDEILLIINLIDSTAANSR